MEHNTTFARIDESSEMIENGERELPPKYTNVPSPLPVHLCRLRLKHSVNIERGSIPDLGIDQVGVSMFYHQWYPTPLVI